MQRFDIAAAKAQMLDRNRIRAESGLPLLSMASELRRAFNTHRQRQWQAFLEQHRELYDRVLRRIVNRYRVGANLPASWHPGFALAVGLQHRARRTFARRFRE